MELYKGSMRSGGAVAWFLQRLTAVVLLFGLLWHFLVLHYLGSGHGITYEGVLRRLTSPFWRAFEWIFLLSALFHAMNGVLAVVRDFRMRPSLRIACYSVLVVLGVSLALLGTMTILNFNHPRV